MYKPDDEFRFRDVVDLKFGSNYVIHVKFDDGAERTIDFEPILLGSLFGRLAATCRRHRPTAQATFSVYQRVLRDAGERYGWVPASLVCRPAQ